MDLSSVDSLTAAYTGADGVFIHLPLAAPGTQEDFARNVAGALEKTRPARVVFSTSGYPASTEAPLTAHGILAAYLGTSGLSYAVVEPRLYLENLLLPPVLSVVKEDDTLQYPLKGSYKASWSSHLDVADVVVKLLTESRINGNVSVGSLPALSGADLARGFSAYLGTTIRYESISPKEFGIATVPLFGEAGVQPVVEAYEYRQSQQGDVILEARSAQKLLGIAPRTVEEWLKELAA
ncbi:Conserved hypothetical protein (plasmid) [Paenarthrobacter aurescens TC1]|uniref:NmrA-like domain-containing protein n=1 Tax=Paenarthrobacter aurescens (strain TC1) TaxID=290340 RepID=A1RDQ9_PAEAT|nr:Conserved hypothetical protein [Paenarthrobacter aurescens TC1]